MIKSSGLLALFMSVATFASAANERNTVFTFDASGAQQLIDTATGPAFAAFTATGPVAASTHWGQAYAPTQTLRSQVELTASQPGTTPSSGWILAFAETDSAFYKEVLIDAGSSGLAPGTVVPLTLTLNLHGIIGTGGSALSDLQRVLSSLDFGVGYRIADLDDLDCGGDPDDGCQPRLVASFGFSSRVDFDYNFGGDGLVDLGSRYGWSSFGTLSGNAEFQGPDIFLADQPYVPSFGYTLTTGALVIDFESAVGHTLRVDATMDNLAQALGVGAIGWSLGDFASTFDAELQSPVAGLLLMGETPGVLAVPEPSSWALMLAGLAVVGRLARRRMLTRGMSDRPSSPALG